MKKIHRSDVLTLPVCVCLKAAACRVLSRGDGEAASHSLSGSLFSGREAAQVSSHSFVGRVGIHLFIASSSSLLVKMQCR